MTNSISELKKFLMLFGVQDARVKTKIINVQQRTGEHLEFLNKKINGFITEDMTIAQASKALKLDFESSQSTDNIEVLSNSNSSSSIHLISNSQEGQNISVQSTNTIKIKFD